MERILTVGPELAMDRDTMPASPRVSPFQPVTSRDGACLRASSGTEPEPRACRLAFAYYTGVAVVLAVAGYPGWRIGAVAAAAALQQVAFLGWRSRDIRRCVNADLEHLSRAVARGQLAFLATTFLAVAFTGGVRSPLLPTVLAPYFAAVAAAGDRRPARILLAATAAIAGGLAAAPAALTGPPLGPAAYGVLAALSLLGLGALLAPVHARARQRREEFARWRKELAAEALARAQSLEQVGAKVAHELKNPLTGVKALVQLGLRNPAEAASHERLEVVDKEVTRMQEILQNYLSFTRPLQAVAPRAVELGPIVSDTLTVLAARADEARVRLYAQGDATVEADPRRLREALLNLVANAIEATPAGGEVLVEVRPGDETEIVVRDNGRGMPAEVLRRIGTPFFTTRDDGTGLGVVLARSVIAQHGGSIRYDSEPGRGTSVRITLPRSGSGGPDAARAARR